jgi:hypothetical protein
LYRITNRDLQKINSIYNDTQNVHSTSIQSSIKNSIFNIMQNYNKDYILTYLDNTILTHETKQALIEYSQCDDEHTMLNITFEELLKAVFIEINTFTIDIQKSILQVMNTEMSDSICKCFTGRLSRLVNCLSGFSDKVNINISNNEEISNIIITLKNKITNIEELKHAITHEMNERGYTQDIIDEWLLYIEE